MFCLAISLLNRLPIHLLTFLREEGGGGEGEEEITANKNTNKQTNKQHQQHEKAKPDM